MVTLNACRAEVTDEALITSGSGNIAHITVEYVLSKQLCVKPLTCCALLISYIQHEPTLQISMVPDLMFGDNYLMIGCVDKPEGGISVGDDNSSSPGGLVLLLITIMTYWHSTL